MHSTSVFVFLFITLFSGYSGICQNIRGVVADKNGKQFLSDAVVENMYSHLAVTTNKAGEFVLAAGKDELIEIRKPGYKSATVRLPKGILPPYFKILLEPGFALPEGIPVAGNRYDYRKDSLMFREIYKHELDFEKLSTVGKISHPFSAMSKRNREIWRFQESYADFEQEKYVDRTFNSTIVSKFTGLSGDSLRVYMVRYRPNYEQLRSMNDYNFYTYILHTSKIFRTPNTPRTSQ